MNGSAVACLLVVCVVAGCQADGRVGYGGYNDGFRRVPNGVAAVYSNDDRQRAVNRRAESVGASSGTARFYDVPGTNRDFGYGGYGGYGGARGGYGGPGYGGPGYAGAGYAGAGYGGPGYGGPGYAGAGYGGPGYAGAGYAGAGYGGPGYGGPGYGAGAGRGFGRGY